MLPSLHSVICECSIKLNCVRYSCQAASVDRIGNDAGAFLDLGLVRLGVESRVGEQIFRAGSEEHARDAAPAARALGDLQAR
jgi:hypothetical protein